MRRFLLGMLTIAVLTVASSVSSFAGYTGAGGNLNNGTFKTAPTTGASLLGDLAVEDFRTSTAGGNAFGDFDGVPVGTTFFSGVYNFTGTILGTTVTIGSLSSPWGMFTGKVTNDSRVPLGGGELRSISITGDFFTGTDGYYPGAGLKDDGVLILTFSKATALGSVTSSWALDTTFTAAVPEPTSIAIFGLGAVGFAVRRFRRK